MSAEYCKMSSNNQASKGNEKTPINSSGNGTEKSSGNMETYGGSGESKGYETNEANDQLTGQQEQ